jgi:hypothetical protein
MPSKHETIATVVSFAATDDNATDAFQSQPFHEVGNTTTSILHENQTAHSELGYRQLVDTTRLLT